MAEKYLSDENLLYVWQKIKLLLSSKADLNLLSNYALKSDITSIYKVKGSTTWDELISITNAQVGDVYNVVDRGGANYVCLKANTTGSSAWDALGEIVDLSNYPLKSELGALAFLNSLNKGDVGLGNVDNTSDLNKPISTATQTALNTKVNNSALVNYVDIFENQTIEGVKNFKDGIKLGNNQHGSTTEQIEIDGGVLNNPNLNDMTYRGIYHCDKGTNTPNFDYGNTTYDLMVFNGSEYDDDGQGGITVTQMAIIGWQWWIRRNNGSDWGAWERFGQATVVNSLTNAEIDAIFNS